MSTGKNRVTRPDSVPATMAGSHITGSHIAGNHIAGNHITGSHGRRAFVLVAVLMCVLVVGLLAGTLARSLVSHLRQAGVLERKIQSRWLATAGVERARARLASEPDYRGERWEITAESLGGRWPAVVIVRVQAETEPSGARRIDVTAQYPPDLPLRVTHHRQITITAAEKGEAP